MSGVMGGPLRSNEEQRRAWHDRLAPLDFDPEANFVAPAEARANPAVAVAARLSILLDAYRDDYHTDSFDLERLCPRVERGEESIAFWGDAESVAALRRLLAAGAGLPPERELAQLELGTATLVDAAAEFGPGHRELCRGGSRCRAVSAVAATISALQRSFGPGPGEEGDFGTVVSVVRNRSSEPGVAGGAAVHRLYTQEVGSSFWGFAPWYVMQGGALELLDYREVYRDSDDVRVAISAAAPLCVGGKDEAALVADLLELNLGPAPHGPRIEVDPPAEHGAAGWNLLGCENEELLPYNHALALPAPGGEPLEELLVSPPAGEAACVVARLPLVPASTASRAALRHAGFQLTAISPPKGGAGGGAFHGFWSRPRAGLAFAEPYYAGSRRLTPVEARLVARLGEAVAAWSGSFELVA